MNLIIALAVFVVTITTSPSATITAPAIVHREDGVSCEVQVAHSVVEVSPEEQERQMKEQGPSAAPIVRRHCYTFQLRDKATGVESEFYTLIIPEAGYPFVGAPRVSFNAIAVDQDALIAVYQVDGDPRVELIRRDEQDRKKRSVVRTGRLDFGPEWRSPLIQRAVVEGSPARDDVVLHVEIQEYLAAHKRGKQVHRLTRTESGLRWVRDP